MAKYRKDLGRKMTHEEKRESVNNAKIRYSLTDKGKLNSQKSQQEYYNRTIGAIMNSLNNVCAKCGFKDRRALHIDHINGGGNEHRRKLGKGNAYYSSILKSIINQENLYQILCANCNYIKRMENNEHRNILWNLK